MMNNKMNRQTMDNPRYLHTLYCDDIRQEVNGKAIHIGVYGGVMQITVDEADLKKQGGITIPKLCLVSTLNTPVTKPMGKIDFSIKLNGETITSFPVEMPSLPDDSTIRYQTCNAVNTVSLFLRGDSELHVTARIGKQEIDGPSLMIRLLARRLADAKAAETQS